MKSLSNVVLRGILCSVAVVAVSAAPQRARAQEPTLAEVQLDPQAAPPLGTSSRLMWTGAALTVGWYGASLGTSYIWQNTPAHNDWRIPVVGPWMALGQARCSSSESNCSTPIVVIRTALTLISSIGQLGGLLAFTEGLLVNSPSGAASRTVPGAVDADLSQTSFRWLPLPLANPNGLGLGILGTF